MDVGVPWRIRAQRMLPFAVVTAGAFSLAAVPHQNPVDGELLLVAALVMAATSVAIVAVPWSTLPDYSQLVAVGTYCLGVGLLREAGGGADAGFFPLLLIPVIWQALYGRTVDLVLTLVASGATLVLPVVLIGDPTYPVGEWRMASTWMLVNGVVALVIQQLVQTVRGKEATIGAVMKVARGLAGRDDVRSGIVDAALELGQAELVMLFEPQGLDRLTVTRGAGRDLPPATLRLEETSATVTAFLTGRKVFVADCETHPGVSRRMVELTGCRSLLAEPVLRDGRSAGVLVIAWRQAQAVLPEATIDAVHLLAAEAAVAIDQSDLVRRLEGLASHDPLTGLMNRRAWNEHLDREVQRAERTGRPLSLAIIDLDHFKRYNDTHGHLAGDRLLKAASAAWTSSLRGMDVLARWGGEEFALLLPDTDTDDAVGVVQRLLWSTPEDQTFSAGIAALDDEGSGMALTAAADDAVYAAKRAGRNCIKLAEGARSSGIGPSPRAGRPPGPGAQPGGR